MYQSSSLHSATSVSFKNCAIPQRQYRVNRFTPTIITIIILFLMCPSKVLKFTEAVATYNQNFLLSSSRWSAQISTNFAINFILYCVLNVHFRNMVKHVLLCKWLYQWPNMKPTSMQRRATCPRPTQSCELIGQYDACTIF